MTLRLPNELWLLVLDDLPLKGEGWRHAFLAAALVCQAWTAYAQRKLFRLYVLCNEDQTSRQLVSHAYLARHSRLASYITCIEIRINGHNGVLTPLAGLTAAVFPKVQSLTMFVDSLAPFQTLLLAFPTVTVFNLSFPRHAGACAIALPTHAQLTSISLSSDQLSMINSLLRALQGTESRVSLRHICVTTLKASSPLWTDLVSRLQAFPSLQRLELCLPTFSKPTIVNISKTTCMYLCLQSFFSLQMLISMYSSCFDRTSP
jgi:hypothetical protein